VMGGSTTTITDLEKEKLKSEELSLHPTFCSATQTYCQPGCASFKNSTTEQKE